MASPPLRILILGCGSVGVACGRLLAGHGHVVCGVRRTPASDPGFRLLIGDAADAALWPTLPAAEVVLLTATPGLRRAPGGGNRLDQVARLARAHAPSARFIYSGSTAVYGEAGGAAVDEDGPLAPGAEALLAIEDAVLAQGDALVLRCPALVGPGRTRIPQRARAAAAAGTALAVPGDPDRPFSLLHDADLARLLVEAVDGRLRCRRGILNAAAPHPPTLREHYTAQARAAGLEIGIVSDGRPKPARAIDATRLWELLPEFDWQWGRCEV